MTAIVELTAGLIFIEESQKLSILAMGGSVSQVFRSTHRDGNKASESTIDKVQSIFEILRTNPKV